MAYRWTLPDVFATGDRHSTEFFIAGAKWKQAFYKESGGRCAIDLQQISHFTGTSQVASYSFAFHNTKGVQQLLIKGHHDFNSRRLLVSLPLNEMLEQFPNRHVIVLTEIVRSNNTYPKRLTDELDHADNHISVIPGEEFPNKLAKELAALCMKDKFSDLRLISKDGIEIPAHGLVLRCRSAWFNRHLQDEGSRQIRVDYFSDVVRQFLRLIYSLDTNIQGNSVDCMKLYEAADTYEVDDVKMIIRKRLLNDINRANVCTAIVFAYKANDIEMKNACLKFLRFNCDIDFFNSGDWVVLKTDHKDLVIDAQESLLLSREKF